MTGADVLGAAGVVDAAGVVGTAGVVGAAGPDALSITHERAAQRDIVCCAPLPSNTTRWYRPVLLKMAIPFAITLRSLLNRTVVFAACSTVLSACGSTANRNDAGIRNVTNRAQFDLDCPRPQLGLTPLQYDGALVTSYAVVGCGKRVVYVRGARNTFTLDPGPIQGQPTGSPSPAPPSR